MAKLLKISGRILGSILEWSLILIILLAFAIRTSVVQTFIAQKATNFLASELDANIQIGKVDFVFFDRLALEDILLEDQEGDTILAAKTIYVNIDRLDTRKRHFLLGNVEIEEADIHIQRDENGVFNYQFIKEYFTPKKKRKTRIGVSTVDLVNCRFRYDDHRKERQTFGVDYFHIDAKEINGSVGDFVIEERVYSGTVNQLSCLEKSGFKLENIYTEALVQADGVFLTNTEIQSPGSKVYAESFNMLSTGFIDFKYFVDSVDFDGTIDRSTISLKEAALFAPLFKGMEDDIQLRATLSKKTKNLRLSDLDLRIKDNCQIMGTLNFPDYRNFNNGFFDENIDYANINLRELTNIKLPESAPFDYISLDERVARLKYIEAQDIKFDGFLSQFVIATENARTALGNIRMDNGVMFTQNEESGSLMFEKSGASAYDVKLEQFDLGHLIGDPNMGLIDGIFFLSGEAFSSDIQFTSIEGKVNRLDYNDYPYSGITILEGKFMDQMFEGAIDVDDDNLEMTYRGIVDFKGEPHLSFTIDIANASLEELNMTSTQSQLSSMFTFDLYGKNPNDFHGTVLMNQFSLTENNRTFNVPSLQLEITRGKEQDVFRVDSDIARGTMKGKLDFNHILDDLNYNIGKVLPALYSSEDIQSRDEDAVDHFEFDFEINEAQDFMAIFFPSIQIAQNTKISGHYFAEQSDLILDISTDSISYKGMKFTDVKMHQILTDTELLADYQASSFLYNDSIDFENIHFKGSGSNNKLNSDLVWGEDASNASTISWETQIKDPDHLQFTLDPSHFFLEENKWEVAHMSKMTMEGDTLHIDNFELIRNEQKILLDGYLSNRDEHQLNFNISNFELNEISDFISAVPIEGKMNAAGFISNPLNNFKYQGDANIYQLKTDNRLVGDVNLHSEWVKRNKSIALQGDLNYKGHQTFDFIGDYYPLDKTNNLDFNLFFDHTDINFTNAFMNPEVVSNIKGLLNGTLKVTGTPDAPILDGSVKLLAGSAKAELLGAHFGIEGAIEADEYGFYINGIPVFDEDGNAGMLIGSIYHDNFKDFNFDLVFDLEIDAINKDPLQPWIPLPLERFMVLNSSYTPGDVYYGKGYATGMIELFGYTDNLEVTVNLKTAKGTKIDIPMYGIGDIEEESFIIFVDRDTTVIPEEPKIDFTGVDLDLNFEVTPEAQLKLIFNEELEDEITARGNGDIDISLNNIGDVTMAGTFNVKEGVYDFAMGPVKEKFYIQEGGSINWTGDPYDAILNLRTYYKVNANIAAATNDQFGSGTGAHQEILCYLDLTETLMKPTIDFDLEAPRANEIAKSVITRIKSDPDELNRQFFSLLLWKRFQPLSGTTQATGSAAIDLVANQINALLSKVSDDYTLNVKLDSDQLTGDNTYEFGVSTGFLDDRLILSGSFGVENHKVDETHAKNSLIGDVNLEYLLNKSGTFRVNIFNESNDKTIIQNEDQGAFTQGAGLYYKEDFHNIDDFKMVQYFLDLFRKKGNKRYPRKRKQVPVTNSPNIKDVEDEPLP